MIYCFYPTHREISRDARLEFIVSPENHSRLLKSSFCLHFLCIKTRIIQPYAKKFDALLVNNDKLVYKIICDLGNHQT